MWRNLPGDIAAWLNVTGLAVLAGATVYQMMVVVPEYNRDLPNGMIAFAASHVLPANFWTSMAAGAAEAMPFIALALNWKTPRRKWLLLSAGLAVAFSLATVIYFLPRLGIMGQLEGARKPSADLQLLAATVREWTVADQVRFWFGILPSFLAAVKAVTLPASSTR